MKYIRSFFVFWRHFILGDDSTIAIVVMWSLLLTWSSTAYFFNIWILMPVSVIAMLSILCYNQISRKPLFYNQSEFFRFLLSTAIPFIATVALPSLAFRFINHIVDVRYTLMPLSICLLGATLLSLVLFGAYKKFPALIVFLFGITAFVTVLFRG